MAEQVDGSIVIDTKLDNKGFQKGSDELKSAMTSLTQQLNSIGAKLSGILSAANKQVALLSKAYGDVGDSAKQAGEEAADAMDEAQKSAEKFDPNQVSFTVQRSDGTQARITNDEVIPIEQTEESAERVEDAVDDVNEAVEQSQEKIHAEFEQTAQKAQETAQKTEESAQSAAETAAQSAEQTASQTEQAVEQAAQAAQEDIDHIDFGKPHQAADTFEQNIGDLNRTLNMMGETGKAAAAGDKSAMKEFQAQAKSAQSQIDFLRDELDKFGEAEFETSEHAQLSAQYEKAQAEVDKLSQKLDAAKMKQDALNESFAQSSGVQDIQSRIDEYQGYLDKEKDPGKASSFQSYIDQMKQQIADMQSKFQDSAPYQKTQQDIAAIEQRLEGATQQAEQYKAAMDEVPATFQGSESVEFQKYSDAIDAAESKLAKFETAAAGAKSKAGALAALVGGALKDAFAKIGSGIASAASSLMNFAKTAVQKGILTIGSKISSIGKKSTSASVGIAGGFKKILAYGFGIRSLFVLFNKLRSAIAAGFTDLASKDTQFSQTIGNFKAALQTLQHTLAAAFQPIASAVLPLLTSMINAMSEAISKVGQLIASLMGQSTFKKANAVQFDAGQAAAEASDSMSKENKSAQKLKKTLAGFDDVEILSSNDNSSTPAATKTGGYSGGGYTDADISKNMGDLAKKIKDAWKNADFTSIGRMVGDKINESLKKIPWAKIKSTLQKIGKSIATFLNGVMETPGLFSNIGNTLAQGLNSAFELAHAFVSNFHWDSFGQAIHDLLLGALNNIDWSLIYSTMTSLGAGIGTALETALDNPEIWTAMLTTVSNGLNSIVYGIRGFIASVDWGILAQNIAIGLNNGIQAFDWSALAQTLILGINGAFAAWYSFVTTFDFATFGQTIGTNLSTVINGINWTEGGAGIGATITGLFEAFNGFIQTTDWKALGASIINFIIGFFSELDWGTFGETISGMFIALANFFTGAIQEVDWAEAPRQIGNAIAEFLKGIDWTETANAMFTFIGSAIGAAARLLVTVGGDLWSAMKDFGKDIMEGGWQGIIDALANVGDWIYEHVCKPFIDGFKTAFGIASPSKEMKPMGEYIVEGFFQGIIDTLATVGEWIKTNIFDPFIGAFKTLFGLDGEESALVSLGKNLINGFLSGITGVFTDITTWIQTNITDPFVNGIKTLFGIDGNAPALLTVGENLIGGLKDGIVNITGNIGSWLKTNVTDKFVNGIKGFFGLGDGQEPALLSVGKNLIEGLKTGLKEKVESMGDWVEENVTGPICGFFKNLFGIHSPSTVFHDYGGYLMEGLQGGIEDNTDLPEGALSATQEGMQGQFDFSENSDASWKMLGRRAMTNVAAGINASYKYLTELCGTMNDGMKGKFPEWSWNQVGRNVMKWLNAGITDSKHIVTETVTQISQVLQNSFSSSDYETIGSQMMTALNNGIVGSTRWLYRNARDIAENIEDYFDSDSFDTIGTYIIYGLNNGLCDSRALRLLYRNVNTIASNVASYFRAALGINSPSKLFAWFGEMIDTGLAKGIEGSQDDATGAASSMADAVSAAAQTSIALDPIETSMDGFADRMVDSFSQMVSAMEAIANGANFTVPALATGSVTPYASRRAASQSQTEDLSDIASALSQGRSEGITRDQLTEVLSNVLRQYMNFDFYIGDEQIARHANRGNAKLNRRYGTTG